jgi:ABC-type phosphate transport system substrate-binding protein
VLRTSLFALVFALIVPLSASTSADATAQDTSFLVIVHPDVEGTQISRATLSSIFLRDVKRWRDGQRAYPVDRSLRSPVREAFTRQVLPLPAGGIQQYWNAKIMKGILPPLVKETDAEVLKYVAETKGAIGYVSADVTIPTSVRALAVID